MARSTPTADEYREVLALLSLLYWHELDPDAEPDPSRPCPDDCLACELRKE